MPPKSIGQLENPQVNQTGKPMLVIKTSGKTKQINVDV